MGKSEESRRVEPSLECWIQSAAVVACDPSHAFRRVKSGSLAISLCRAIPSQPCLKPRQLQDGCAICRLLLELNVEVGGTRAKRVTPLDVVSERLTCTTHSGVAILALLVHSAREASVGGRPMPTQPGHEAERQEFQGRKEEIDVWISIDSNVKAPDLTYARTCPPNCC